MAHSTITIARFTFYEAVHNRLFGLMAAGLVCILGLSEFIGELAITETRQMQSVLVGSGLRFFAVCVIGLFVVTSMIREFNDKGFEMMLSLPIPRSSYYFGKFFGFFLLALVIAMAASSILLIYSQFSYVLLWFLSLLCELLIIIALSLLCLFTFTNVTVAFAAVIAFYLLSRSMYVIRLISDSPILEFKTYSQEIIKFVIDSIAFILPDLNIFTQSAWLAYGGGINSIGPVLMQTAIYLVLLTAAGLFDLYRKDF
ncbi:MAG: ABC transporter permease [Gammaproteobacteria bacterium]